MNTFEQYTKVQLVFDRHRRKKVFLEKTDSELVYLCLLVSNGFGVVWLAVFRNHR